MGHETDSDTMQDDWDSPGEYCHADHDDHLDASSLEAAWELGRLEGRGNAGCAGCLIPILLLFLIGCVIFLLVS